MHTNKMDIKDNQATYIRRSHVLRKNLIMNDDPNIYLSFITHSEELTKKQYR